MIHGILMNLWFLYCFFLFIVLPRADAEEAKMEKKKHEMMKSAIKVIEDYVKEEEYDL